MNPTSMGRRWTAAQGQSIVWNTVPIYISGRSICVLGKAVFLRGWQRHAAQVLCWGAHGGLPASSSSASGSICHSLQPLGTRGCHPSSAVGADCEHAQVWEGAAGWQLPMWHTHAICHCFLFCSRDLWPSERLQLHALSL